MLNEHPVDHRDVRGVPASRYERERQAKMLRLIKTLAPVPAWQPPTLIEGIRIGRAAKGHGAEAVITETCRAYRVPREKVGHGNLPNQVDCRSAIVYVLREMQYSFPVMARMLGQESHASTRGMLKRAERLLSA